MAGWSAKVFWKEASVSAAGDMFEVLLDSRPVRTPAKRPLTVPTQAFAEAIAEEWRAQSEEVDPTTMPVTRLANSAIDNVTPQLEAVAQMLAEYGNSDLTCYRADRPEALIQRQAEAWDPLLDWAADSFGARLIPVQGVMHQAQSPAALGALRAPLDEMDAFELAAFHDLVVLPGSLVIGLAAAQGFAAPQALWEASRVDETFQAEQWGADEEAAEAAEVKRQDFLRAAQILGLLAKPHSA